MSLPYLQPYLGLSNGLNTLHAAGAGGGIGGWVELARTTLGSNGDNIDVSSLPDKRYYMVLANTTCSGLARHGLRYNSDSGTNYSWRYSDNGTPDAYNVSLNRIVIQADNTATDEFSVTYIANKSDKEKLSYSQDIKQIATGAGTAPARMETVGKHAQTSNPISTITLFNTESGDYASGSECVVLGWDPADTHTNNFWEELDSVTLSSSNSRILSNVFTSKKYIWIQVFGKAVNDAANWRFRVGYNTIDTGSNYANRQSQNGSADVTPTSDSKCDFGTSGLTVNTGAFANIFAINNASNEKLFITHSVKEETAGATTAPVRTEGVHKWANTSNQFNIIEIETNNGTSNFDTGSTMRIWGAN